MALPSKTVPFLKFIFVLLYCYINIHLYMPCSWCFIRTELQFDIVIYQMTQSPAWNCCCSSNPWISPPQRIFHTGGTPAQIQCIGYESEAWGFGRWWLWHKPRYDSCACEWAKSSRVPPGKESCLERGIVDHEMVPRGHEGVFFRPFSYSFGNKQPKENIWVQQSGCYNSMLLSHSIMFDLLLVYTSMWHSVTCDMWCVMMMWRWQKCKHDDLR